MADNTQNYRLRWLNAIHIQNYKKIASTERDFKICKEMQKWKKSKTHEKVKQLSVREHNAKMTTVNLKIFFVAFKWNNYDNGDDGCCHGAFFFDLCPCFFMIFLFKRKYSITISFF